MRVLAPILLLLCSCSSTVEMSENEYQSILTIGFNGRSSRIIVDGEVKDRDLGKHAAEIADSIETFFASGQCLSPATCKGTEDCHSAGDADRILIYIHGGMVSRHAACSRAGEILERMGKDCSHFYPVFINWDTGMLMSYGNDLFYVINGRERHALAVLFSPFYFLADLGRAISRLPITYGAQGWDNTRGLGIRIKLEDVPAGWGDCAALKGYEGERDLNLVSMNSVYGVVPGVMRIVTTPLLDAFGLRAFTNMRRRASLLFALDADYEAEGDEQLPTGALSMLMREIRQLEQSRKLGPAHECLDIIAHEREHQRTLAVLHSAGGAEHAGDSCECLSDIAASRAREEQELHTFNALPRGQKPIHITLVGHSMGAIAANELIRRNATAHFEDIVYMAPACTIREFCGTALTYLKRNPASEFHMLTLHPTQEQGDCYGFHVLPYGSLLVWIDSFITREASALDWTLGRWNNIMRALPIMDDLSPDVRERMHIRGFGNDDDLPTSHGDFDEHEFWRREYWEPPIESLRP